MRPALVGGLAVAALLSMAGTTAGAATHPPEPDTTCTFADVQLFASAGFEIARLHFSHPTGSDALHARADHIWNECQFRFYDDNDVEGSEDNPEVSHVFSEDDYILGGVFAFYFTSELSAEFSRNDAIADLKTWTNQTYWGSSEIADEALPEITVTHGPYKSGILPFGSAVGNHRYIIIAPRSHEPGEYKWRWEASAPGEETIVVRGTVIITPGS